MGITGKVRRVETPDTAWTEGQSLGKCCSSGAGLRLLEPIGFQLCEGDQRPLGAQVVHSNGGRVDTYSFGTALWSTLKNGREKDDEAVRNLKGMRNALCRLLGVYETVRTLALHPSLESGSCDPVGCALLALARGCCPEGGTVSIVGLI